MEPFLGEIRMFAGNFAPVGWALCDGRLLSIAENSALFTLLGTVYGGDGVSTFGLPDLRGRLPVGHGQGPGLTQRTMGEQFGSDTVALTAQQLPTHSHGFVATTANAEVASPAAALFANTGADVLYVKSPQSPSLKPMAPKTVTAAGSGLPHDNTMASTAMSYIICLDGIYPSRN